MAVYAGWFKINKKANTFREGNEADIIRKEKGENQWEVFENIQSSDTY